MPLKNPRVLTQLPKYSNASQMSAKKDYGYPSFASKHKRNHSWVGQMKFHPSVKELNGAKPKQFIIVLKIPFHEHLCLQYKNEY